MDKVKKMNKSLIFLFIFFIFVLFSFCYLYFKYEKPVNESLSIGYKNISILAIDEKNIPIATNYTIYLGNDIYRTGETLINGAVLEKIPFNKTVSISNTNIDNQNYYTYNLNINALTYNMERIILALKTPDDIKVSHEGVFGENKTLTIKAFSKNFNKPIFCISWRGNIISVITNYIQIEKPEKYKNYDKCYDFNVSLVNNIIYRFNLDYTVFIDLNKDDNIKLVFIDRDARGDLLLNEENGKDLGSPDKIYEIKY